MKDIQKYALLTLIVLSAAILSLYGAPQQPPQGAPSVAGTGQTEEEAAESGDGWAVPGTGSPVAKQQAPVRPATGQRPVLASGDSTRPKSSSSGGGKPTRIRIDNADLISNNEDIAPGVQKLTGNVRFYHGNTLMTCDEAEFNRALNTFFARGNVFVNEGDTLTLNSNYMLYTGDNQLIKSYGDVVLVHKSTTLRTDTLDYDRANEQAYYFCGGTITDEKNTLNSQIGVYRVPDDMVDFYVDVEAWDPDYRMYSDTLHYHTVTKVITAEGPTNIYSDKNKIYTENGEYNTETGISDFYKNTRVSYGRRMLRGDTLHYERNEGYARAISNVELQDTVQRAVIYGDFAEYFEKQDSIIFPRKPKVVQILDKDTLYTRGDTLMVTRRSTLMSYLAAKAARADSLQEGDGGVDKRLSSMLEKIAEQEAQAAKAGVDSLSMPVSEGLDTLNRGEASRDSLYAKMTPKQREKAEKKRLREEKQQQREELRAVKLKSDALEKAKRDSLRPRNILGMTVVWPLELLRPERPISRDTVTPKIGLPEKDSLAATVDTLSWNKESDDSLRVMRAFHHVRFYKSDMSGAADSVFYDQKTGIMSMYRDPVIFSAENQVTADSIYVKRDLEKDVMDSVILVKNAFILSRDYHEPDAYNQVKGNAMRGKIIDNDLRIVHVKGNAETVYYSYDNDGSRIGVNKSNAAYMDVFMKDSQVQLIRFNKLPDGKMLSSDSLPEESTRLKGFNIRDGERPLTPEDIWEGPVNIDLSFAASSQEPATAGRSLENGIDPALKPEEEAALDGNTPEGKMGADEPEEGSVVQDEPDVKDTGITVPSEPGAKVQAP